MRAFVAVELPSEIKNLLEAMQGRLRGAMGSAAGGVRWTRPESVHITLQFLGDIPPAMVSKLGAAMTSACAGVPPVELALGGVGVFPNANRPRVIWVGLEGEIARLRAIESAIGEHLKPLGYRPDKPFQPHVTLGRVRENVRPDELRAISQAISSPATRPATQTAFEVETISLMESHLQAGGSVYTQLVHVVL